MPAMPPSFSRLKLFLIYNTHARAAEGILAPVIVEFKATDHRGIRKAALEAANFAGGPDKIWAAYMEVGTCGSVVLTDFDDAELSPPPVPTRKVKCYRIWDIANLGEGDWDTSTVEIPADTADTPQALDAAVKKAGERLKWPDGDSPVAVGYYGPDEEE